MNLIQRLEYMARDPKYGKCAQAAIKEIMDVRQRHKDVVSKLKWAVDIYSSLLNEYNALAGERMTLNSLEKELTNIIECIDFDYPKDRHYNASPCGEPYVVCKYDAARSVFQEPEDALCRMFLSRIIADIRWLKTWQTGTDGKLFEGDIKLYWRVKPEIEDSGEGIVTFYARYLVVGERKKQEESNAK